MKEIELLIKKNFEEFLKTCPLKKYSKIKLIRLIQKAIYKMKMLLFIFLAKEMLKRIDRKIRKNYYRIKKNQDKKILKKFQGLKFKIQRIDID